MHAYIVFAHPDEEGLSPGEVLAELCRGLDDGGHSYEIGDLYEMDFKCEMTPDEYIREMNVQGNRPTLSHTAGRVKPNTARSAGQTVCALLSFRSGGARLSGKVEAVGSTVSGVCGYAYDVPIRQGDLSVSTPLHGKSARSLSCLEITLEGLVESGIAEAMRRLYTHDRLRPDAGVKHCEFAFLPGMADHFANIEQHGRESRDRVSVWQELPDEMKRVHFDISTSHFGKFSAGSTFNDQVSAGHDKSVGEWRVIYGTGHLLRRT